MDRMLCSACRPHSLFEMGYCDVLHRLLHVEICYWRHLDEQVLSKECLFAPTMLPVQWADPLDFRTELGSREYNVDERIWLVPNLLSVVTMGMVVSTVHMCWARSVVALRMHKH
jgi:hypothetical protein